MALLSVDEALRRILDGVDADRRRDRRRSSEAAGACWPSRSPRSSTQPPFDASAMDGYAVRAADVASCRRRSPSSARPPPAIRFAGSVGAGAGRAHLHRRARAGRRRCHRHPGEHASATAPRSRCARAQPRRATSAPAGFDFRDGETLLDAGRRLGPRELSLAAAMGHGTLPVRRRPRVAILATGDELVPPGERPGPGQIVASNHLGVAALAEAAGAEAQQLGIARDTRESLDAHFAKAADADVIVTIGGASVGDHDLVAPALEARGMTLAFWKIAMRPGKPLMFGRLGDARVLGLPGNPGLLAGVRPRVPGAADPRPARAARRRCATRVQARAGVRPGGQRPAPALHARHLGTGQPTACPW